MLLSVRMQRLLMLSTTREVSFDHEYSVVSMRCSPHLGHGLGRQREPWQLRNCYAVNKEEGFRIIDNRNARADNHISGHID